LFIVFLLTGLWHGASLTFVFWGLFHGFFMIIERIGLGKVLEKNPLKIINHIYMWIAVICGWVFFRLDGMRQGISFIKAMFCYQKGRYNALSCLNVETVVILVLSILLCGVLQTAIPRLKDRLFCQEKISGLEIAGLCGIFFLCVISLSSNTYNPFIYFRF